MAPHPGHTSEKPRPQLQAQVPPHPAQLSHAPASLGSPLWSTKQLWAHSPGGLHAAFICSRPASHSPHNVAHALWGPPRPQGWACGPQQIVVQRLHHPRPLWEAV